LIVSGLLLCIFELLEAPRSYALLSPTLKTLEVLTGGVGNVRDVDDMLGGMLDGK